MSLIILIYMHVFKVLRDIRHYYAKLIFDT